MEKKPAARSLFRFFIPFHFVHYFTVLAALLLFFLLIYLALPYPPNYLSSRNQSVKIRDRAGGLLVELTPKRSGFSSLIALSAVSPDFIKLLLYTEDRKYYSHAGVRPLAMARALVQNVKDRRYFSGGSTITQQLVKLYDGISRNNAWTKFLEIFKAIRLNLHFSKNDILASYINQVYLGNHLFGVQKAAEIYFHKDAAGLSLIESAALIRLIKEPSRMDLYQNTSLAQKQALSMLSNARIHQIITEEAWQAAKITALTIFPNSQNLSAPHFALWALDEAERIIPKGSKIQEVITTLDIKLYKSLLEICRNRIKLLRKNNAHDLGLVYIDNKTMEVRAMIGSLDYFGEEGMINAALIKRQAASTMKAFTYSMALEGRQFTPATILPDIYSEFPSAAGKYIPRNYNGLYHGPVRLAMAFGSSYNVPAVYTLSRIGLARYYEFLKKAGFSSIDRPAEFYGLGLTLGNADVTLLELARAYTIFPNSGMAGEVTSVVSVKTTDGKIYHPAPKEVRRIVSPETAFLISHILSDYKYKVPGFGANSPLHFPFPLAVKTGTSKDFRDNFLAAFDREMTIGIWNGNLSGEPMRDLPSAAGGGVVLRDIALYLYNQGHSFHQSEPPMGIVSRKVCRLSGMISGDSCDADIEYFIRGTEPQESCTWHRRGIIELPSQYSTWASENLKRNYKIQSTNDLEIVYPVDGDIFQISSEIPEETQQITLRADSRFQDIQWFIGGKRIARGKTALWQLSPGEFQLTAYAGSGKISNSVKIIIVKD